MSRNTTTCALPLPLWQFVCSFILMVLAAGLTGCEGQQNANKAAFAAAEEAVKAHEKHGAIFDHMVYKREEIHVFVKEGSTLPEDKGAVVQFVAQTMGDALKADPTNKLKELHVKGFIGDEELWVFRYDMKDGQVHLEKSRLVTTI